MNKYSNIYFGSRYEPGISHARMYCDALVVVKVCGDWWSSWNYGSKLPTWTRRCCLTVLSRFGESSCKLIIVLDSTCQDGRVGLRRQFQVLVRKGMGSNPILDRIFLFFVLNSVFCSLLFLFFVLNFCVLLFPQ